MVFDYDDCFFGVDQLVEQVEDFVDVGEVQVGCWFIQNVDVVFFFYLDCEFDLLMFIVGQC